MFGRGYFEDVYLLVTEQGGESEPTKKGGNYLTNIVKRCWSSWIFW
jgi:hypothetical protein